MAYSDKRELLARDKKIKNLRIVIGVLVLVLLYGLMGRMDRAAQVEHMRFENPIKTQKLAGGVRI